jgi:GntP family gluconate:H+ symporter
LPNDSFYWLVRRDALTGVASETRAIQVLAGGALIQAIVGLCLLLSAMAVFS